MSRFKSVTVAVALVAVLVLSGCSAKAAPTGANASPSGSTELKVFKGMGQAPIFRARLDKETNQKKYSTNYVVASALFDQDGKVLDVTFDTLELTPPDGEHTVGVFTGWPTDAASEEKVAKEVADWKTKREKGDEAYGMNWSEQIDSYQDFFKGKTVAEIEAWFAKNASDVNGKPLTDAAKDPKDVEKFSKLTKEEKDVLADVTSGASISMKDAHGDFIGALKEAFENKKEVVLK